MKKLIFLIWVVACACLYSQTLSINTLFSDNMVLQRNEELSIYGKATPESEVTVTFHDKTYSSETSSNGEWNVELESYKEGGPFILSVSAGSEKIELKNIMIGDVWICSGQSNMNMPLEGWGRVKDYKEEIKNADYPEIRLLTIPLTMAAEPQKEVDTDGWKICTPENIENFSAVSYFYGRKLYQETNVPIGLLHVSKGGTPVESWMCEEDLSDREDLQEKIEIVKKSTPEEITKKKKEYKANYNAWVEGLEKFDVGLTGEVKYYDEDYDFASWSTMYQPGVWETTIGDYDGVVWFAREIELPETWAGNDVTVDIGPVQDYDITYFNGEKIGDQPKRNDLSIYNVEGKFVKSGKNRIAVRILDNYGSGGMWGRFDKFEIRNNKTGEAVSLAGNWHYKPVLSIDELEQQPPQQYNPDRMPITLFNGMISPILGVRAAGVIWYQGESNTKTPYSYREMFQRMITSWRKHFNNDDMYFYFVQLANYTSIGTPGYEHIWGVLRESQASALKLEKTGMATAIDLGDEFDVHPKNKQEVGRRLALNALHSYYGKDVVFSGPVFREAEQKGDTLFLSFDYVYDGFKISDGKPIREFTIAGEDGKFYEAKAFISGERIGVCSEKVKNPKDVRYAFLNYPLVNLYNSEGLPVYPFRTDEYVFELYK